jgi:hypothetical protein
MATHGSLEVRELRREVVTIVSNSTNELNSTLPTGNPGSGSSELPELGANVSQMVTQLAALKYPPQYQAAERQMLASGKLLTASLEAGQANSNSGNALLAAVNASQRFYTALGIPSVCTTTSGS